MPKIVNVCFTRFVYIRHLCVKSPKPCAVNLHCVYTTLLSLWNLTQLSLLALKSQFLFKVGIGKHSVRYETTARCDADVCVTA